MLDTTYLTVFFGVAGLLFGALALGKQRSQRRTQSPADTVETASGFARRIGRAQLAPQTSWGYQHIREPGQA